MTGAPILTAPATRVRFDSTIYLYAEPDRRYWAEQLEVSEEDLARAVRAAGVRPEDVRRFLGTQR